MSSVQLLHLPSRPFLHFSPMLFLGGPAGKFAWAVPAVVVLSLIMSIFESVVMLPLHLSNERKANASGKEQKRAFVIKLEAAYRTFLGGVLRKRYLVVLGLLRPLFSSWALLLEGSVHTFPAGRFRCPLG